MVHCLFLILTLITHPTTYELIDGTVVAPRVLALCSVSLFELFFSGDIDNVLYKI